MKKFLQVSLILFIFMFINIKGTYLYYDLKVPLYASYYYDVGALYIKAHDVNSMIVGNGKVIDLKKPEKNRKNGLLSSFSIGKTNQRIILFSQNDNALEEFIDKTKVLKRQNNELEIKSDHVDDILAIHATSKKDYLCINEDIHGHLRFLSADQPYCKYKNDEFHKNYHINKYS